MTVSIAIHEYPLPELAGFANAAQILDHGLYFEFILFTEGLRAPDTVTARWLMGIEDIVRFWKMSESFLRLIEPVVEQLGQQLPSLAQASPLPSAAPPQACSIIGVSRAGLSGMLDCYHVSSRSLHYVRTGQMKKLEISPLFAVQIPVLLMISVLQHIERLVPQLVKRTGSATLIV